MPTSTTISNTVIISQSVTTLEGCSDAELIFLEGTCKLVCFFPRALHTKAIVLLGENSSLRKIGKVYEQAIL